MGAVVTAPRRCRFVVIGPIGRDLVLRVQGRTTPARRGTVTARRETLGGKGANQAVAISQLGGLVSLIGVVGDDGVGQQLLARMTADGIDVSGVVKRGHTALSVDMVGDHGERRILEHVPEGQAVTGDDVRAAETCFRGVDAVCVRLPQQDQAVLGAMRLAKDADARLAIDGGMTGGLVSSILAAATIVRANAEEATQLSGVRVRDEASAVDAARRLLATGPRVVALEIPGRGDLVAWRGGGRIFPYTGPRAVDPTGGGDAFFAGLVTGLLHGRRPPAAGSLASRAAARTVRTLGGRPQLVGLS